MTYRPTYSDGGNWILIGEEWVRLSDGYRLRAIKGGTSANTVMENIWAFGDDDGSESAHSLDTENAARTSQAMDTPFMVRMMARETAGKNDPWAMFIYCSYKGGAWTELSTTSSASMPAYITNDASSRADEEATTHRLSDPAAGTFIAGEYDDGTTAVGCGTVSLNGQYSEWEFCVAIDSTYAAGSEDFEFRLEGTGGTDLNSYAGVTYPKATTTAGAVNLTVRPLSQANTVQKAAVTTTYNMTVAPLSQANTVDKVPITKESDLVVDPLFQSNLVEFITGMTQQAQLIVSDLSQSNLVEHITLVQIHNLQVDDLSQSNLVEHVSTTKESDLVIDDLSQSNLVEFITGMTQQQQLIVYDLSQSNLVSPVVLTQLHVLTVDDLSQSNLVEHIDLTQLHVLQVDDLSQSNLVEKVNLTQVHVLVVDDLSQSNTVEKITLSTEGAVVGYNLSQANTVELVSLTQIHNLSVDDLLQATTVEKVNVNTSTTLTVADLSVNTTVEVVTLVQIHNLSVDSLSQSTSLASYAGKVGLVNTTNLIGHWPMNEPVGQPLGFNGTTSDLNTGSSTSLDDLPDAEVTFDFWVKNRASDPSWDVILGKRSGVDGWRISFGDTNDIYAIFQCNTTNAESKTTTTIDNDWHHITIYFNDAGDRKAYIAIDGNWEDTYAYQVAGVDPYTSDAAHDFHIGGGYLNGWMGWVRVSNNDRYNHGVDFSPPSRTTIPAVDGNTVSLWPLNEGYGTVAGDLGPNNNDGTIANCDWPSYPTGEDKSPQGNDSTYVGVRLGDATGPDGLPVPYFDGLNDYNNIWSANLASDFNENSGTFAIWAKVRDASVWTDGTTRSMGQFWANSSNVIFMLKRLEDNTIRWAMGAGGTFELVNNSSFSSTGWFHMALTWDKAGDGFTAYLNGVQEGTQQAIDGTWAGSIVDSGTQIGSANNVPVEVWDGWLAHAVLWDTALSPVQIATLANPNPELINFEQVHNLQVADLSQANSVPLLSLGGSVSIRNLTQANTVEKVSLTQVHNLSVDDLSQSNLVTVPNVNSQTTLTIGDLSVSNTVEKVSLTSIHNLSVDDLSQSNIVEEVILSQVHVLNVHDLSQANSVPYVPISGEGTVTPFSLSQTSLVETVTLVQEHNVFVYDLSQSNAIESIALVPVPKLDIYDLAQANSIDYVGVTTTYNLMVYDLAQVNTVDYAVWGAVLEVYNLHIASTLWNSSFWQEQFEWQVGIYRNFIETAGIDTQSDKSEVDL